jgi:hypothetical protein
MALPFHLERRCHVCQKIAVIVGSLRKDSINRKFAHELMAMAPASLAMQIVEIGELPPTIRIWKKRRHGTAGVDVPPAMAGRTACCSSRPNTTALFPPR